MRGRDPHNPTPLTIEEKIKQERSDGDGLPDPEDLEVMSDE